MRWFKHMTASANDEKLSMLRDEFGLAGYGFWWSVVEIIAGNLSEDEQTSVTFSPKKWGNSLGISPKKFQQIAEFCAKIELFRIEISQKAITIDMPNILKFKDEYTGRRTKKSGHTPDTCRDNVRPSRARGTETDTEKDIEYTPLTPLQGETAADTSGNLDKPEEPSVLDKPAPPDKPERPPRKREPTGNSLPELRAAIDGYTPDPELRQALMDFRAMRERIRKPLTGKALDLTFAELDKHAGGDTALKARIVLQSVQRGWQGVFPLKEAFGSSGYTVASPDPVGW